MHHQHTNSGTENTDKMTTFVSQQFPPASLCLRWTGDVIRTSVLAINANQTIYHATLLPQRQLVLETHRACRPRGLKPI